MNKVNQLKMGTILTYINLGIGSIIPLIYTPIMLRLLPQNEYGLYSLSNSVIGYLSLLSFGFGSAIVRYVTKYKIEGNKEEQQKIIGLFIFIYTILAGIVIIFGSVLVCNVETIFSTGLNSSEIIKLKIMILIMTINTAVTFPASVYSAITVVYERFVFRKSVDIFSTILMPVLNLIVLLLGYKSIGLTIASCIAQLIIIPLNIYYCRNKLNIKPIFKDMPFRIIKELISFSGFVFLASIVDMLYWSTDKVLIGSMIGASAVAIYNVGGTFTNMIQQLSMGISSVLIPRITGMVFNECSNEELSDLFIKIGRLQFIIVSLVVTGFIVFGRQFIIFMAGVGYEDAYIVALLTMIPLSIPLIQNTGLNILIAKNKHKFRAIIYTIIAVLNVISTVFAIKYWGIIGAVFCSCIAFTLGNVVIINIYYAKVIKLDIIRFWNNIIKMSIVPIVMTIFGFCVSLLVGIETVPKFLVGVIIYTLLYVMSMIRFAMNQYERNIFLKPINKMYRKTLRIS
ncbi:oligosaccharide flippase family protein [Terrisporobacter glycolicus]|uniref:oligosaccharide flippase family protein n=1 Tax=Terrisporobacter glycolicus TaxID=36841 RepID=UPI000CDF1E65